MANDVGSKQVRVTCDLVPLADGVRFSETGKNDGKKVKILCNYVSIQTLHSFASLVNEKRCQLSR